MFHSTIMPRFTDTDALGHINNTVFAVWFEDARMPIFKIFHPSLAIDSWPLIVARVEIDLLAQTYWGREVTINTWVEKVGNSSFHLMHEAWQDDKKVASGKAILINFDYDKQTSTPIPEHIRGQLFEHSFVEDN